MNVVKVQLDDVAFKAEHAQEQYGIYDAQPAVFMIEKLNAWKQDGHKIIIETNRDINTDMDVTLEWLKHYEVPYDELQWSLHRYK